MRLLESAGVSLLSHTSQSDRKYSSHSTRAASTSKVAKLGLPIEDIIIHANWTQRSTSERFYHNPIDAKGKNYQATVLKLSQLLGLFILSTFSPHYASVRKMKEERGVSLSIA